MVIQRVPNAQFRKKGQLYLDLPHIKSKSVIWSKIQEPIKNAPIGSTPLKNIVEQKEDIDFDKTFFNVKSDAFTNVPDFNEISNKAIQDEIVRKRKQILNTKYGDFVSEMRVREEFREQYQETFDLEIRREIDEFEETLRNLPYQNNSEYKDHLRKQFLEQLLPKIRERLQAKGVYTDENGNVYNDATQQFRNILTSTEEEIFEGYEDLLDVNTERTTDFHKKFNSIPSDDANQGSSGFPTISNTDPISRQPTNTVSNEDLQQAYTDIKREYKGKGKLQLLKNDIFEIANGKSSSETRINEKLNKWREILLYQTNRDLASDLATAIIRNDIK